MSIHRGAMNSGSGGGSMGVSMAEITVSKLISTLVPEAGSKAVLVMSLKQNYRLLFFSQDSRRRVPVNA
jgi:hypothetical protein